MSATLQETLKNIEAQMRPLIDKGSAGPLSAEDTQILDRLSEEAEQIESTVRATKKASDRAAQARDAMGGMQPRIVTGADTPDLAKDVREAAEKRSQLISIRGNAVDLDLHPNLVQRCSSEYIQAFRSWLRDGAPLGGPKSAVAAGDNSKGGYLAPSTYVNQLIKFLDDMNFVRRLSTVIPLNGAVNVGVPSLETDPGDADWTPEVPTSDISEDTAMRVGKREMIPHLLTKRVDISMKLIRSAAIDVETLVAQRLAYKLAATEEKAFLSGNGAQRPLGVFTASADGVTTGRDFTASKTTDFSGDDVIDCMHNCKAQYMANGSWIFSREFLKRARKLKTGDGQYLWSPGLGEQPNTILGRPYYVSEYAPSTFTTGLYVAIFGDFKAGYWVIDSMAMSLVTLYELGQLRNKLIVLARQETDGAPVLAEAFSRMKLA